MFENTKENSTCLYIQLVNDIDIDNKSDSYDIFINVVFQYLYYPFCLLYLFAMHAYSFVCWKL